MAFSANCISFLILETPQSWTSFIVDFVKEIWAKYEDIYIRGNLDLNITELHNKSIWQMRAI